MKAALIIILILVILLIISLCTTTYVLVYSRKRPVINFRDTCWSSNKSGSRSGRSVGSGSTIKPPLSLDLSRHNDQNKLDLVDPESPLFGKGIFEDGIKRRTTYIEVVSCYSSSSSCDPYSEVESTIEFQSGPKKLAHYLASSLDDEEEAESNNSQLTEEPTVFGDMTMEIIEVRRVPPAVLVDKGTCTYQENELVSEGMSLGNNNTCEAPRSVYSMSDSELRITSTPIHSLTHQHKKNLENINQISVRKFF